ncbi:hypothetical protein Tco_1075989 [Tanacetum coccineum]
MVSHPKLVTFFAVNLISLKKLHLYEAFSIRFQKKKEELKTKLLVDDQVVNRIPYPQAESWGRFVVPLCQFEEMSVVFGKTMIL